MREVRRFTADGIAAFARWLENPVGNTPPPELVEDDSMTEPFGNYSIDPAHNFESRFDFGVYLNTQLSTADFSGLMSPDSDGLWAWLAVVYFPQLTAKGIRRAEHYVVIRKGSAGSLAYRHSVRTPYELVRIHGRYAQLCLKSPMHTFGELTEQLASRQAIAHNKGFFKTASGLYLRGDGRLKRGASSKPKKPKDRKPGDSTGLGSVRRLAIALQRLDLTYDTEEMPSEQMTAVLPREFRKYMAAS